jgi:hypothetical protein
MRGAVIWIKGSLCFTYMLASYWADPYNHTPYLCYPTNLQVQPTSPTSTSLWVMEIPSIYALLAKLLNLKLAFARRSIVQPQGPQNTTMIALCKEPMPKIRNKSSQKNNCAATNPILIFMCLWAIYIFPRSICLFCCRKYVDRSWKYINRSQKHECGNWNWGHAIPRKGIHNGIFIAVQRL